MSRKFRVSRKSSFSHRKSYTNPFFLFLAEFRQHLKKSGFNCKCTEQTKLAGRQWRQMSASEKLTYVTWARKNRELKKLEEKQEKVEHNKLKVLMPPEPLPFLSPSATLSQSQQIRNIYTEKAIDKEEQAKRSVRSASVSWRQYAPMSMKGPRVAKNQRVRPRKYCPGGKTRKIVSFKWYLK